MTGSLRPEDPERLGEYWLAGRLGAGGQGVVYEAYDGEGRRVAIKVLHGDAATDPELKGRFWREATAARRVASFCTARVIAAELDGRPPYLVSEYVEGPSLRHAVQEGRTFGGDDLHRLGTAIATALTAIHEAGVIHRDLKPDNVLLGPDGPRVIDFGVARTLEMSLTSTGLVAGTPTYMAPEVFTGQRAGGPADVFAWGGVMLFAASGEDPFKAESLGGVMHRVLSVDPDLDVLPESLRPLVGAALRKEPLDRPTARDLLLTLVSGGGPVDAARLLEEGSRAAGSVRPADAHDPALGTLAEDAYGMLSPTERNVVPEVFLRMVAVGPDGELTTRRVPEDELPPEADRVLQVFSYVLSRRDGEVSLARPALLRAWPRLRSWTAEERDGLTAHAGIRTQARQWAGQDRRDGDLLQGSRLDAAVHWAATGRRHLSLNPLERDFLDASTALTRRRARRRRLLTLALAILLVVSLAGGGLATYQGSQIAEQRDRAKGRELAYLAGTLRTTEPTTAMLLSVAAWKLEASAEARSSLMSSLHQPETAVFRDPPVRAYSERAMSQDGRRLVSVSRNEIRLYDVRAQRLVRRIAPSISGRILRGVALSPSGRLVAVATEKEIAVWDLVTGGSRGKLPVPVGTQDERPYFGGDESEVAVVEADNEPFIWDLTTGRTYGREGNRWSGTAPAVSPSGRLTAMLDSYQRLVVRRIPGGVKDARFRRACPGTVGAVTFSPDGKVLACAGREIRLVATDTGKPLPLYQGDDWWWTETGASEATNAASAGLRFSADGRFLVGFADRSIRVWRVADQRQVFGYRAEGEVTDVRFDSGGGTLRYLLDDSVISLDLHPLATSTRAAGKIFKVGLSPDGRWMSAETTDSTPIRLWDVRRHRFAGPLPGTADSGVPAVFDARSQTMVTVSDPDKLRAWDVGTLKQLWSFTVPSGFMVEGRAFSPDGTTFAASLVSIVEPLRARLLLWDARTGHPVRTMRLDTETGDMTFTPDGRRLATTAGQFIDAASGKQVGLGFNTSSFGGVIALSPTGTSLAVSGGEGRIALWDTRGPTPVPPILHGAAENIALMAFSSKGDILATVGETGTVQLWDMGARRRLGDAIKLYGDVVMSLAFTPDASLVYVADQSGTIYELPVADQRVAEAVCARAARTLTRQEWERYLPDLPYRNVCSS
ncbi:MAG: Serine/threonine protein kinaselike protein [Sphaerisporangium sp.]|nr:Serine/threonine protein kinaselike protein [Sphaerisporangium sp.]